MKKPKKKKKPGPASSERVMARAKDLHLKWEVLETFEAGMALMGSEVKSIRDGRVNLKDSYCRFKGHELYIVGMHISPYSHGTHINHEPERPRKLLLHKRQLVRLQSKVQERGLTIVPSRLYFLEGKAKLEIVLARGKKRHDRREEIKRKDQEREMEREIRKHRP
ncbi:MAG: SsrA-binding protein SmpB [bacterium]